MSVFRQSGRLVCRISHTWWIQDSIFSQKLLLIHFFPPFIYCITGTKLSMIILNLETCFRQSWRFHGTKKKVGNASIIETIPFWNKIWSSITAHSSFYRTFSLDFSRRWNKCHSKYFHESSQEPWQWWRWSKWRNWKTINWEKNVLPPFEKKLKIGYGLILKNQKTPFETTLLLLKIPDFRGVFMRNN